MRRLAYTTLFLFHATVATAADSEPDTAPIPPEVEESSAELPEGPRMDARLAAAFGDHLLVAGDPFNALTQYRLARWLEPDHPRVSRIGFRIGLCYEIGERWSAAEAAYLDLAGRKDDARGAALYRAGLSALADRREGDALVHFGSLADDEGADKRYRTLAPYARGLVLLEQSDLEGGLAALDQFVSRTPDHPLAGRIATATALAKKRTRRTSPALAGVASTLIPGSGQLLAGHPADAGRAFVSAGVLGAWSATLIAHGTSRQVEWEIGSGVALGTAAILAWTANVIGAVRGAKRANARRVRRRAQELLDVLDDRTLERDPRSLLELSPR